MPAWRRSSARWRTRSSRSAAAPGSHLCSEAAISLLWKAATRARRPLFRSWPLLPACTASACGRVRRSTSCRALPARKASNSSSQQSTRPASSLCTSSGGRSSRCFWQPPCLAARSWPNGRSSCNDRSHQLLQRVWQAAGGASFSERPWQFLQRCSGCSAVCCCCCCCSSPAARSLTRDARSASRRLRTAT